MLRMAVVGVGWAGTRHVEAARELGRKVTVNCLVDNDADHLRVKAEALGVEKAYVDYQDALADPEIDVVSICTPHERHLPMALEAASAGKHILVEKPMATCVADATRMIESAEAHGVRLYVAENEPYTAQARLLRQFVTSGEHIGELTFASWVGGFRAPEFGYPGRRAWLTLPEEGGTGTWMLHGIHSMAKLRFVLGEVETVYMQEHHASSFHRTDLEGTMSGLLTLENGVCASVVQSCETHLPYNLAGFVLHGDQGTVRTSRLGCEVFRRDAGKDEAPLLLNYPEQPLSPYALEIEAFADTVAGDGVGPTTGRSERRSLAIIEAGYESARVGRPVHLRQWFGEL